MRMTFRAVTRGTFGFAIRCRYLCVVVVAAGLLSGCISKVQIPAVDQFQVTSGDQTEIIDVDARGQILLENLYQLLKANEGVEVPMCTAERDTRQCLKEGVSFFVFGGGIPGAGSRSCVVFSDILLDDDRLAFSKDNRGTKFIGTPMTTRANTCRVHAQKGGLQVEMDNYYANWMAVGNSIMAEGWAIDYMDVDHGVVGLQLELDVKGIMVTGGGSRYVLLKFPNLPETDRPPGTQVILLDEK